MRSRKAETEKTEQEEDFMLYCDAGLPQSAGPYAEASEALEKWIRNGCTPGSGFSGRTAAELERAGLPRDRLFPENITEISYGGRTLYPQKQ